MTIKRKLTTITFCFAAFLNVSTINLSASTSEVKSYYVDGVNMTRWADTAIVYMNKATTEQNEWGHNVVVSVDGVVTKIIQGGNIQGKNLAVPKGGMVVSATGNKVQWLKDNVKVGDYAYYDSVSSRVLFSETNAFTPFFREEIAITGFNVSRNADTVIIYNQANKRTGTNPYGYEAIVNSDGYIISTGGNDNLIPQGGFVISVVGKENIDFLKMFGIIGTKVTISGNNLILTYDQDSITKTILFKTNDLTQKLDSALEKYWILPYDDLRNEINIFKNITIKSNIDIKERNELINKLNIVDYKISEKVPVETRGIWHETREKTVNDVKKVVSDLKSAGINQLNLGISNGYNTIFPLPSHFPFKQDPSLNGVDILKAYVEETKAAGIELVLSVPIYYNKEGAATKFPQWLTKANKAESEEKSFFSPASEDFKAYVLEYIRYILENYEIDGFQLDYIRYPQSFNGLDYGYDDTTKEMFAEKYGVSTSVVDQIAIQQNKHAMYSKWVEFKASLVTALVSDIRALVDEVRPDVYLSAAVAAETNLATYHQDTARWAEEKLLDVIYPMTYGEDLLSKKIPVFNEFTGTDLYLVMGSGAYMNLSYQEIYRQTIDSRYQTDGIAFFEYYSYFSHGYNEFFNKYLFDVAAISPTYNSTAAAKAQIDYMIRRINEVILPNNAITQENANQLISKLNKLKVNLNLEEISKVIAVLESLVNDQNANQALRNDLNKITKILELSKDKDTTDNSNLPQEPSKNVVKPIIITVTSAVVIGSIGSGLYFFLKKKKLKK